MKQLLILVFVSVFLIFGCKKENNSPYWDVELLTPVVSTTMTIDQLVNDTLLQSNVDSSIKLVFDKNLTAVDFDTLYNFDDTTITSLFAPGFNFTANPGLVFYSQAEDFELNVPNGIALNYAEIREGFIEVQVTSDIDERTIATFTIPKATLNGVPLTITEEIPANGSIRKLIDVSNYNLDLTGTSGSEVNTLSFMTQGKIADDGQATPINAFDKFVFQATFRDIVPEYLHGYFGNQQVSLSAQDEEISFFNKIVDGTINIEDVNVNLIIENGVGIDAQLTIGQLVAKNSRTGQQTALSHSLIGNTININRATETGTTPEVNITTKNYVIDVNNSNIKQFIETLPDKISYNVNLAVNPYGNVSGNNDFFYQNYGFNTWLNFEMPLSFIATDLTMLDTLDFDLSANNRSHINKGKFIIDYENFFPFTTSLRLTFLDSNKTVLGQTTTSSIIESGILDNTFKVTAPTLGRVELPINESLGEKLSNTRYLVLKAVFNTQNQANYQKIYTNYYLKAQIIADLDYHYNPNSND